MTPTQKAAFLAATGVSAATLTFWIRILVGGVAIVSVLLILVGLMHYLDSGSSWDKSTFILSILLLAFVLTMVFAFVA